MDYKQTYSFFEQKKYSIKYYKVLKQYSREYNEVPFPPCKLDTVTLKNKTKNPNII